MIFFQGLGLKLFTGLIFELFFLMEQNIFAHGPVEMFFSRAYFLENQTCELMYLRIFDPTENEIRFRAVSANVV